ncbi:MAG: DUF371 domain-containing protein [Thermoproteota archaeon]|nr:DUF371 domain-containing protein [Thermoproteota archaeon]
MGVVEIVEGHGDKNVKSTHKTTFELTKETALTKRGNCVIVVGANKGAADLSSDFKEAMKKERAQLTIIIETGETKEIVEARGSPQLSFTHPTDLVVRKSNYICSRTLAIKADKAANNLSRKLVKNLQNPNQKVKITLKVKNY